MEMQNKDALQAAFDAQMQSLTLSINTLTASGREDEANLQKAARNIYGICAQLLEKFEPGPAYEAQLDRLQLAWQQARDAALQHNDHARVTLEDTKLSALFTVRQLYADASREGN